MATITLVTDTQGHALPVKRMPSPYDGTDSFCYGASTINCTPVETKVQRVQVQLTTPSGVFDVEAK